MALGASFVHHVVAGYNFLIRFYEPGAKSLYSASHAELILLATSRK